MNDDLISRKLAIEAFKTCGSVFVYDSETCDAIISRLKTLPSAEPEVIRCKDCKYRPISTSGGFWNTSPLSFPDENNNPCPCKADDNWYSWIPADDWYCAEGKRKGEQE